jgi:hypothetical protein
MTSDNYRDALEDCLKTMRERGDVEAAIARNPRHEAALRNDVALASAIRIAGSINKTPQGAEGRAGIRMAAALREARTDPGPMRESDPRKASLFDGWLRPIAVAGIAALVLVAVGLTASGGIGSLGGSTAEAATIEGVVVENANGTLSIQTSTGLETVSLGESATVQDESSHSVALSDIAPGQVVRAQGKKASKGPLVAKQVVSKSPAELRNWCVEHGDACQLLEQRIETQVNGCGAGDAACQRLKQPLSDARSALEMITREMGGLKDRCDGGGKPACQALEKSCKDHPMICAQIRQRNNGSGGPGPGNGGPGAGNGPQRPPGRPRE